MRQKKKKRNIDRQRKKREVGEESDARGKHADSCIHDCPAMQMCLCMSAASVVMSFCGANARACLCPTAL